MKQEEIIMYAGLAFAGYYALKKYGGGLFGQPIIMETSQVPQGKTFVDSGLITGDGAEPQPSPDAKAAAKEEIEKLLDTEFASYEEAREAAVKYAPEQEARITSEIITVERYPEAEQQAAAAQPTIGPSGPVAEIDLMLPMPLVGYPIDLPLTVDVGGVTIQPQIGIPLPFIPGFLQPVVSLVAPIVEPYVAPYFEAVQSWFGGWFQ